MNQNSDYYSHVIVSSLDPPLMTITRIWRVKWFKWLWYKIRKQPTKYVDVYENVKFTSFRLSKEENGVIAVIYDFTVPPLKDATAGLQSSDQKAE